MKKNLLKLILIASMAAVPAMSAPIATSYAASTITFPDVKNTHWAYSTIQWAAVNGVVTGYPDGTFRPNKQVSEAEFLMMFIKAYQKVTPTTGQSHWADPVYAVAQSKNWPVRGVSTKGGRDVAVTRGEVAEIVAAANGVNFMGTDAVKYLLGTGLSSGKTDNTIAGYKSTDLLTRAEAVAFILKAKNAGLTELKERPTLPSSVDLIPATSESLPASIENIKTKMEKVLASSSAYANFEVLASSVDVGVSVKGTKKSIVGYSVKSGNVGSNDLVVLFDANNDTAIQLTVEMMKAAGVQVPSDFAQKLKTAAASGEDEVLMVGAYKVSIEPSPSDADKVTIKFRIP